MNAKVIILNEILQRYFIVKLLTVTDSIRICIYIVYISVYFRKEKRKPSEPMFATDMMPEFLRLKQAEAENTYNAAQEKCKILLHTNSE